MITSVSIDKKTVVTILKVRAIRNIFGNRPNSFRNFGTDIGPDYLLQLGICGQNLENDCRFSFTSKHLLVHATGYSYFFLTHVPVNGNKESFVAKVMPLSTDRGKTTYLPTAESKLKQQLC